MKSGALIPILLIAVSCGGRSVIRQNNTVQTPVTVRVVPAGADSLTLHCGYVGTVTSSRTATLTSPAAGTLSYLGTAEGRRVSRGTVLARVESQITRSAYDAAKSRLDQAEDGWNRAQKVHDGGVVSEAEFIKVKTMVEEARAAYKAAEKALQDCEIKAPFNGVADAVFVSEGVETRLAEPVMRIVDISSIEIRFPLPENEYRNFSVGTKARIEVPALGRTFDGSLASKGVTASPLSHSYDCTLSVHGDKGGLMPGMVCKVFMETPGTGQVTVPSHAVMTDSEGHYVWTVSDGRALMVRVGVGGYSGDGVIITRGLEKGTPVIVDGARKVSSGMIVKE
ncbi:MAG: efflux RND transporter periplasmic adaptor subunit [Bacteroidales bacterium]|nr:efflux RND transporter periplasmic adaptor subunit [Bacteroidales bacterium]